MLARYVHRKSQRADKPFISVNCAAIPENLLESELFGHEKGAFTGAIARRIGKFEEANGGTLLLDEISEMDARLQAKLLRAIQEREIDRVGGTKPVKVDIRIIATSNRDLAEAVKHGTFREDLLYRLNVVNLRLPALRERPKDIQALARHFAHKYAEANGVPYRAIAPATERLLPGASLARQCARAGEHHPSRRAAGDRPGHLARSDPPARRHAGRTGPHAAICPRRCRRRSNNAAAVTRGLVGRTVADVERDLILDTLDHCLGNRTHAANILGISIRTLRNKLREYSQRRPRHSQPRRTARGERLMAAHADSAVDGGGVERSEAERCLRADTPRPAAPDRPRRQEDKPEDVRHGIAPPPAGLRSRRPIGRFVRIRRSDLGLAVGIMAILVVLILPLPPWLLDMSPGASRCRFSILILMTAVFIQQAAGVQLASRPSC